MHFTKSARKVSVLIVTIGLVLAVNGCGRNSGSASGDSSSSGIKSNIAVSDVSGHWVGPALDITLSQNGSFISSSSGFAGGSSRGKWHISNGNTVVIDFGDGGETLLFSLNKNDTLVASNGRALHRR